MLTKAVRLDQEVIDTLAEQRVGFETPNECLKRSLNAKMQPCTKEADAEANAEADATGDEDSES